MAESDPDTAIFITGMLMAQFWEAARKGILAKLAVNPGPDLRSLTVRFHTTGHTYRVSVEPLEQAAPEGGKA